MWVVILLLIIISFVFFEGCKKYIWQIPTVKRENFTLVPYYRGKCVYLLHKYLEKFFDQHGFFQGDEKNWKIYFPCDYSSSVEELASITPTLKTVDDVKWVYIIPGDSYLAGKNYLWFQLGRKYGIHQAKTYMPNTYLLEREDDFARFRQEYDSKKLYIMKKNTQRQKGLLITDTLQQVENNRKDYVVVQELLQNPYLIEGRKINVRFYVLVHCHNGHMNAYVYRDGFMYYTSSQFVKGSTDHDVNVTTGYIDRAVYERNPLTVQDFKAYLEKQIPGSGQVMLDRVALLMNRIIGAVASKICQDQVYWKHHMFQLFGADIAISDTLEPQVLEFNKGPDMDSKDVRDGALKTKLMEDIFKAIKFHPGGHDFVEIYSTEKPIRTS